jgi:hypothetical protein
MPEEKKTVADEFADFYDEGLFPELRPEYAWVITEDHLDPRTEVQDEDHRDEIGVAGPHGITSEAVLYVLKNGAYFEMRDDDEIAYYRGYLAALPPRKADDFDGFEPLDDFGRGNAGCTEIWFAKKARQEAPNGEWLDNPEIEWESL